MSIKETIKNWRKSIRKERLRKRMERINPNPRVYKMWEHKRWGDRIQINRINENGSFSIVGWLSSGISNGDKLLYDVKSGKVAVGYIVNVEYCRDPQDMFFADVIPFEYYDADNQ